MIADHEDSLETGIPPVMKITQNEHDDNHIHHADQVSSEADEVTLDGAKPDPKRKLRGNRFDTIWVQLVLE